MKGVGLDNFVDPLEWKLDPEYMYRILGNLISNAVKFSRRGDRVRLSTPTPETLVVADTGTGISEDIMAALGEQQSASTPGTEGEPGSGRGLQQCFELIRVQGGRLTIESPAEGGSRFTIHWPVGAWRESSRESL